MSLMTYAAEMIARYNKIPVENVDIDHANLVARMLKNMPKTGRAFDTIMLKVYSKQEIEELERAESSVEVVAAPKVKRARRDSSTPSRKDIAIEATRGMVDRKQIIAKLISIGIGATTANTYASNIIRGVWK